MSLPNPYQIIVTLGPASAEESLWNRLVQAGATAFRLNTSHLSLDDLEGWLERLLAFQDQQAECIPVVLDLQGSKWRLGRFTPCTLQPGEVVELILAAETSRPGALPVPHADFFAAAPTSSGEIVLNDAKIRLRVETAHPENVLARVTLGGEIAPNKGITFTASAYRVETLSDKDRAILASTRALPGIRYAISYVKDAAEIKRYRELITGRWDHPAYLIAKLERGPAVSEADQFVSFIDELWLCRGDLGAELGLPEMGAAAHRFSARVRGLPVPCILAGQVLEHLSARPAPTRSEVCCMYDALAAGYRGFVLSDETAIGPYPVEACRAAAMFIG
jgi:pyruvate kinase